MLCGRNYGWAFVYTLFYLNFVSMRIEKQRKTKAFTFIETRILYRRTHSVAFLFATLVYTLRGTPVRSQDFRGVPHSQHIPLSRPCTSLECYGAHGLLEWCRKSDFISSEPELFEHRTSPFQWIHLACGDISQFRNSKIWSIAGKWPVDFISRQVIPTIRLAETLHESSINSL